MEIIKSKQYPYYHPGLGIVVTSKGQYKDHLKRNDLTEVGNERPTLGSENIKEKFKDEKR